MLSTTDFSEFHSLFVPGSNPEFHIEFSFHVPFIFSVLTHIETFEVSSRQHNILPFRLQQILTIRIMNSYHTEENSSSLILSNTSPYSFVALKMPL